MQTLSRQGLSLIQQFESFVPEVYICPAGYPTIGYGHVVKEGERLYCITEEDALTILKQDVGFAERGVRRWIHAPISQYQFDALVSFTFNLGTGALQRSTLRRKVNRGQHGYVPGEFRRWVYTGGKKLKGLVHRRDVEAQLYRSGSV